MIALRYSPQHQRGQSLIEFCVVVPTFLFLVLVIFQFVLIYRTKSVLDYAAFQAARAGAVNGARKNDMADALAGGLTPLFVQSPDVANVLVTKQKIRYTEVQLFSRIEVIAPTRAAFNEFRERQYDGHYALPNDSLAFRNANVGGSQVNVQDANILKIKVTYNMPLIVPFVDRVIVGLSDLVSGGESYTPASMLFEEPISGHRRLPIESYAVVRMQSPIYEAGNLDH
ncbi:Flp pilus assembly protein TadG [Xanthomonas sacchari]|uniref:TadE/TadG family type IV pilus assembly protein n=1 Tax=Xanthomonas sacchari TaxID=56458 RepID=UPI0020C42AEC|nr:TadE family protein [Xanthomonas sacchari]MDQ1091452.1 Flp pilus assembly protein TadG [Xanthomonas sacchari]